MIRVPPGCSPVVTYLWDGNLTAGGKPVDMEVDALDYWPLSPGIVKEGNRQYIVVADLYSAWPSPTHERLEDGDVRPIPVFRKQQYFNRSRRILPRPPITP